MEWNERKDNGKNNDNRKNNNSEKKYTGQAKSPVPGKPQPYNPDLEILDGYTVDKVFGNTAVVLDTNRSFSAPDVAMVKDGRNEVPSLIDAARKKKMLQVRNGFTYARLDKDDQKSSEKHMGVSYFATGIQNNTDGFGGKAAKKSYSYSSVLVDPGVQNPPSQQGQVDFYNAYAHAQQRSYDTGRIFCVRGLYAEPSSGKGEVEEKKGEVGSVTCKQCNAVHEAPSDPEDFVFVFGSSREQWWCPDCGGVNP